MNYTDNPIDESINMLDQIISLQNQLHNITKSLSLNSKVFNEEIFHNLNPMFSLNYIQRNKISEQYNTKKNNDSEFYSCIFLQTYIMLELDLLGLCCLPHSENRGCVRIGKFNGNKFPIDLLLTARQKIIENINSGIDMPCSGCQHLLKKKWEKSIYPVHDITINDWTECNLKCDYCYTLDKDSSRLTGEKKTHNLEMLIKDMFNNHYISPNANIVWGGGEISFYNEFEPTSKLFIDNNIKQIVNTNAIIFSKAVESGLKKQLMTVQISIDSGTRETYKVVKGMDYFKNVCKNIENYSNAGNIVLKYIIYNKNSSIENINNFINIVKSNNIKSIVINPETNSNIKNDFTEETIKNTAYFINEAKKNGFNLTVFPFYSQPTQDKIEKYLENLFDKISY